MKTTKSPFYSLLLVTSLSIYADQEPAPAQTPEQANTDTSQKEQPDQSAANATPQQHHHHHHHKPDPTPQVLGHFAQIVGNFITLLQNPNNPQHVTANVSNMVGNIVGMVMAAVKHGDLPANATQDDIDAFVRSLDHAQLADVVIKRTQQTINV